MNHLLTILLSLFVFHISAQEIDYDFGNNGIADLDIAANSIHETGNGIILTDFSFSLAIDNDGIVRTQFGNNGTISSPFPSSGIDFISHSLILNEKLVLLGCSRNVITQALDVYITHHDLETGEVFDGLTYTFSDTLDREYSAIYVDTDLHLFGYQNSQTSLFSLFHSTVDIETSEVVRDGSIEETGVAIPYIPFEFVNLSDGRILAIYTQDLSSPIGPRYFEVIEDVSEVRTESSLDLLPWVSDWDVAGGTVELNPNSILIVRNSKLAVLDIINQIEETIELDFVEDPFDVQSIQKYDEETFLEGTWK